MSKTKKVITVPKTKAKVSQAPLVKGSVEVSVKIDDQVMKTNEVRFETSKPGEQVGVKVDVMFVAGPEFGIIF